MSTVIGADVAGGKDRSVVTVIEMGDDVFCDFCGDDYTHSDAVGGIQFGSKAACPKCAPEIEASASKYGESSYIKNRAEKGQLFRDFVIQTLRGGEHGKITITSF